MQTIYSRVPAAAVRCMFDGHFYACIPHRLDINTLSIVEDFASPRMVRAEAAVIRNGEAYIPFAQIGDALTVSGFVPFGVTIERAAS